MLIKINERAEWISPVFIDDQKFYKIFQFFVINSPVDGLSSRQKSLLHYGWKTPWRKPIYLRQQLNQLTNNSKFLYSAQDYNSLDNALIKSELISFPPNNIEKERACIYNCKGTQYLSLFFHIRNALAHGRFNTIPNDNDYIFLMEDASYKRKNMEKGLKICSARMVIRMSTLIKWIDLIESGETPFMELENK